MRASATAWRIVAWFARSFPKAVRLCARWIIASRACSAVPMVRMQWWIRPGPRRPCAISKPRPSPRIMFVTGTRTSSKTISAWSWTWPKTARGRTMVTPLECRGTRIIECWPWSDSAVPLVRPIRTKILHSGRQAPLMYHLCPLMTYSSPSRWRVVLMFVASLLATPGSVIAYALRISPSRSGSSHCLFCSGVPYFSMTSMFPVSGAVQFIATLQRPNTPNISAMGAYSSTLSFPTSGRKKL
mmetsp:Transcript_116982/g.331442  ORF Transcript_116982/g.331442 Transcript_116982/m.331442 type:complete len:242 (-) Transcript_116982:374-1099(-)